jgi:CheY-like chemotaxis protein
MTKEAVEAEQTNKQAEDALQPGTAVQARHGGKEKYYPGKIHEYNEDGTYKILYDDGDREIKVARDLIKVAQSEDALQPGIAVQARHGGKEKYYPGKIHAYNGDGTYKILYDDGDREIKVARDLIKVATKEGGGEEVGGEPVQKAAVFRILVVDDNPFDREIIVDMFEDAPYPVEIVSAGGHVEATAILESQELNLVLMDFHLEIGFDTAEYLPEFVKRDIPVVVMSGDANCGPINECLEKKLAVDYLVKPITARDIANFQDAGVKKLRPSKKEAEEAAKKEVEEAKQAKKEAEDAAKVEEAKEAKEAKKGAETEAEDALQPGTAVQARHGGKEKYYPGKIHAYNGDGTYKILYDDGDREIKVARDLIKVATKEGGGEEGGGEEGAGEAAQVMVHAAESLTGNVTLEAALAAGRLSPASQTSKKGSLFKKKVSPLRKESVLKKELVPGAGEASSQPAARDASKESQETETMSVATEESEAQVNGTVNGRVNGKQQPAQSAAHEQIKKSDSAQSMRRGSFRVDPEITEVFRVLVVDDNPFDREIIVDMFEAAPYPVEINSAGCQEEAAEFLETKELHLVLMD